LWLLVNNYNAIALANNRELANIYQFIGYYSLYIST